MNYQPYIEKDISSIMNAYQVGRLAARVLAVKQLDDVAMKEVLNPPALTDPLSATGMEALIKRIKGAIINKEKVLVCGDYDADGICATAILYQALLKAGIQAGYYIPNRFKEGYGLHPNTVTMAKEKGYTLLITVDNGVKAYDAAKLAQSLGLDLIITDHHTVEGELPPCLLFLHPTIMGESFSTLSGAGVAFEIARALIGDDEELLVLAAVASIGDVMALTHETRAIVRLGIAALNKGVCLPIQKLATSAGKWDETKVSFQVVPKLNVTGRLADMANANMTVRYLLSKQVEEVKQCSKQIQDLNELRKIKSEMMTRVATSLIDDSQSFQILYDETFHEGLTGLVAGKLANQMNQPVMVLSGKESLKGSIRSVGDLDLNDFFQDGLAMFDAYGGHTKAAGLGLPYDKLDEVRQYVANKMNETTVSTDEITYYLPLHKDDLQVSLIQELDRLRPFGEAFQPIVFAYRIDDTMKHSAMSQGKHLKWANDQLDIVLFNVDEETKRKAKKQDLIAYGTLSISTFRGVSKITLMASDIQ